MRPGLAWVLILLPAVFALPPAAFADEPVPAVTWPQVTAFNPDQTSYTFTVADSGTSPLFARWNNDVSPPGPLESVAHTGDHTMSSFSRDGVGVVELLRCPTEATCSVVSTSPQLRVFADLYPFVYEPTSPVTGSDVGVVMMTTEPAVTGDHVMVDWRLRSKTTRTRVAQGSARVIAEDDQGTVHFALDGTADLPDGPYTGSVTITADTGDFGSLTATARIAVVIDHDPFSGSIALSHTWIAPKPDGFRDCVHVALSASEIVLAVQVIVLDQTGRAVALPYHGPMRLHRRAKWCGRDFDGHRVPPGKYRVNAYYMDFARGGGVAKSRLLVRRG